MSKIYAICTDLDVGLDSHKERIKESGIQIGDKIEVCDAAVRDYITEIWLVGYEEPFNSVFFDFIDEDGKDYNIYRDINFSSYR